MAEARYIFNYEEVLEALLTKAGITQGVWQLGVEFGFAASNVANEGKTDDLKPAALVTINSLTLSKADKPSNLTMDASKLAKSK